MIDKSAGGLISKRPLAEAAASWQEMRQAAGRLGCRLQKSFMGLSFLALPVIPELKITDRGLVGVGRFEPVALFV